MNNRFIQIIIWLSALMFNIQAATAQTKPRLLVNIVVSSMQADDIEKYAANMTNGGFKRLLDGGVYFANASYDYMQTSTPVSLATIATGAMPSTHGVVAESWFDYVANKQINLIDDTKEQSVNYSGGTGTYSPRNLSAQTLSDALAAHNEQSRIASVAIEPLSAIVIAGHKGDVYWMETLHTDWTTSTYYNKELPAWVAEYNRSDKNLEYKIKRWSLLFPYDNYHNTQVSIIEGLKSKNNKRIDLIDSETSAIKVALSDDYEQMCYTPAGNSAVLAFAKQLVATNQMGADENPDVLNIVLDTPRKISERFGPESVEYEDMLYRLDRDLESLLSFIMAQVSDNKHIVVTLTSDHGTSPSFNSPNREQERFNVRQAEVIINAFVGAKHGNGQWVLGCIDRSIYLNHNLIDEKNLSLAEMQNEIATFAMQLRGVSHAIAADAMRSSYFGSGYGRKIQNGFYPRRSGDVILNLMPGWIIEMDQTRSTSGSLYRYDTHVPLVIWGGGYTAKKINNKVDMTSLAATQALILGISIPSAAEGDELILE